VDNIINKKHELNELESCNAELDIYEKNAGEPERVLQWNLYLLVMVNSEVGDLEK
jgi:hypothetical protein